MSTIEAPCQTLNEASDPNEASSSNETVVDVSEFENRAGLIEPTYQLQQLRQKMEEFVGLVDHAGKEGATQEDGVISFVANGDPTSILAATSRSESKVTRVLDPLSGNILNIDHTGRPEHGGEEAGVMEISLGDPTRVGDVWVSPLRVDLKPFLVDGIEQPMAEEALVPVSLMGTKPFIPNHDNLPTIKFRGDPNRKYKDGEVLQIPPGVPAIAGIAGARRLYQSHVPAAIEAISRRKRIIANGTGMKAGRLALGGESF